MDTKFATGIFPAIPNVMVHDAAAAAVVDDFRAGWQKIAKPMTAAAAEVVKLRETYSGQVRPKELATTKSALRKAESASRDAEINWCVEALDLLTKLSETWPAEFKRSCASAYDAAFAQIGANENKIRAALGYPDPIPGQRDAGRAAILADKAMIETRQKVATLQAFCGRLPEPAEAIQYEIERIPAALEAAKSELLAA